MSHDFEKLGAFYLGKRYEQESSTLTDDLLLYDSKDLTTHAVCVGMTGSGKTGLCLSLLEEAAIDGIPSIVIDPKGDLGNLLLTFPNLDPSDFRPWVDESEATRKGFTTDEFATQTADLWRNGLAKWGQDPSRIARFRDAVDLSIYTPGSNAGRPLTILRSFAAPPREVIEDGDTLRLRISAAASGLLTLLGIQADPITSREHILLSNIFDKKWRDGQDIDLAGLIGAIQNPPFERVGILDLESFFPADDRRELAMRINNLLASPAFAGWLEGESLDIKKLLYTNNGQPRLSILSIAHLSEAERMFFVTILLNEVIAWMRTQPGTSSLRALLYMDEVFGYFPPTANPPSKTPMLTLLKQARAYGLGVVLATQNPVDLDYKGLSNTGTWFLGRLQTERDKQRVLEGLEGASATTGAEFDRQKMEATLAGLGSRVFLMNNVHDDHPVVFQTRWALSYLRGPLTRAQIQQLTPKEDSRESTPEPDSSATAAQSVSMQKATPSLAGAPDRTILEGVVEQRFLPTNRRLGEGTRLVYRPALFGQGRLHFARATYKVDCWQKRGMLQILREKPAKNVWDEATPVDVEQLDLQMHADDEAEFGSLSTELGRSQNYSSWTTKLKTHFYRTQELVLWKCGDLKRYSEPGETEGDFRVRLRQLAHEQRDLELEKLRKKFVGKVNTLQNRIRSAEARVEEEKSQYQRASFDTMISFGSTLLGAFMGRKVASRTNLSKAATSMRSVGRAADQRGDIAHAAEKVDALQKELMELEEQFKKDATELEAAYESESLEFEQLTVPPRKSDIEVAELLIVWTPWIVSSDGIAEPAFDLPSL